MDQPQIMAMNVIKPVKEEPTSSTSPTRIASNDITSTSTQDRPNLGQQIATVEPDTSIAGVVTPTILGSLQILNCLLSRDDLRKLERLDAGDFRKTVIGCFVRFIDRQHKKDLIDQIVDVLEPCEFQGVSLKRRFRLKFFSDCVLENICLDKNKNEDAILSAWFEYLKFMKVLPTLESIRQKEADLKNAFKKVETPTPTIPANQSIVSTNDVRLMKIPRKQPTEPITTKEQLAKCLLSITRLMRLINLPPETVSKLLTGCFVRINFRRNGKYAEFQFQMARIEKVTWGGVPYQRSHLQLDIRLHFKHLGERTLNDIAKAPSMGIGERDFAMWLEDMANWKDPLPTVDFVEQKAVQLTEALQPFKEPKQRPPPIELPNSASKTQKTPDKPELSDEEKLAYCVMTRRQLVRNVQAWDVSDDSVFPLAIVGSYVRVPSQNGKNSHIIDQVKEVIEGGPPYEFSSPSLDRNYPTVSLTTNKRLKLTRLGMVKMSEVSEALNENRKFNEGEFEEWVRYAKRNNVMPNSSDFQRRRQLMADARDRSFLIRNRDLLAEGSSSSSANIPPINSSADSLQPPAPQKVPEPEKKKQTPIDKNKDGPYIKDIMTECLVSRGQMLSILLGWENPRDGDLQFPIGLGVKYCYVRVQRENGNGYLIAQVLDIVGDGPPYELTESENGGSVVLTTNKRLKLQHHGVIQISKLADDLWENGVLARVQFTDAEFDEWFDYARKKKLLPPEKVFRNNRRAIQRTIKKAYEKLAKRGRREPSFIPAKDRPPEPTTSASLAFENSVASCVWPRGELLRFLRAWEIADEYVFNLAIVGSFVRVPSQNEENSHIIDLVVEVIEGGPPYELASSDASDVALSTNKRLKLARLGITKLNAVSSQRFTAAEFQEWVRFCARNKCLPTSSALSQKRQLIEEALQRASVILGEHPASAQRQVAEQMGTQLAQSQTQSHRQSFGLGLDPPVIEQQNALLHRCTLRFDELARCFQSLDLLRFNELVVGCFVRVYVTEAKSYMIDKVIGVVDSDPYMAGSVQQLDKALVLDAMGHTSFLMISNEIFTAEEFGHWIGTLKSKDDLLSMATVDVKERILRDMISQVEGLGQANPVLDPLMQSTSGNYFRGNLNPPEVIPARESRFDQMPSSSFSSAMYSSHYSTRHLPSNVSSHGLEDPSRKRWHSQDQLAEPVEKISRWTTGPQQMPSGEIVPPERYAEWQKNRDALEALEARLREELLRHYSSSQNQLGPGSNSSGWQ